MRRDFHYQGGRYIQKLDSGGYNNRKYPAPEYSKGVSSMSQGGAGEIVQWKQKRKKGFLRIILNQAPW